MSDDKFNKDLCEERHKNLDKQLESIRKKLDCINDKLDNRFITKKEAVSYVAGGGFVASVLTWLGFK